MREILFRGKRESDGEKIAILDQSIQNSWQGVFELKEPYEEPEQHMVVDWDNIPF